jgi:hypothetical protein
MVVPPLEEKLTFSDISFSLQSEEGNNFLKPHNHFALKQAELGAGVEEVRRKNMCHHCLLITPNVC